MYCKNFSELSKHDAGIAGGKGASLGEMTNAGVPVPPGFVILSDAFEKFLEETDLNVEIDSILHGVDTKAMHTVEHASETIQRLILEAKMPEDIAKEISEDFKKLDARFVAVRSSATAEDSASAAWAGQLDSFLNTTEVTLLQNVQRCFASLFTPRAVFYRFEKGLHTQKISVAVVVQKMVESEVSGIAFSVHPVTEDRNQLIIEAGVGLGEAIVSGSVTPDSYVVEKELRRIIDTNIAEQERGIFRSSFPAPLSEGSSRVLEGEGWKGDPNEWRPISFEKRNQQKLSNDQILELSNLIIKIENHYGFPCDIEWAYEGGKFYIVQSRPITTLAPIAISNVPSFLKPENYTYVGFYKCSIFANWFWTAWYLDEFVKKIGLEIDFAGYTGYAGGHSSLHKQTIRQIGNLLHKKTVERDLKYFDEIVRLANTEFTSAMQFANTLQVEKKTLSETFAKMVEHSQRMMFFWWIGWQFSEIFNEVLKEEAVRAGIPEAEIPAHVPQPDTPLIRQQVEVKRLKKILEERGIWDLLKEDADSAIKKIQESPDLDAKFKEHIEKYEWIQMINWVGDKLTLEKLLEQMTYLKTEEEEKKTVIPDSFKLYADVALRISYIRQAGAEYSSMFENKALPVLEALAKEAGVSVRDMLNLLPEEFFSGPNLSMDISEKIEKRKKNKWFIYVDRDNSVKSIEDIGTAETIAKSFIPIAEEGSSNEFRGNIGNKGKAIGPVRVILATEDFHKMQEGDVLVTPMTTPDFVLLMQKSAAIVTDMGGLLCHAAIVSRELNKPCIIGTNFGTQILHDGDLVEVDAESGVVRILERAKSTEADAMEEYSKVPIKENTEVSYEEFSAMYLKNGWVKIGNWKIPTISLDPFFCSQSTYYLSLYGITDIPPLKYLQVGADVYISKKELDAIRQKIFAKLESEDSTFLADLDTNLTKARNELAESLDTLEHTKEVSHDVLREVLKHLCAVLVMFEVTRDLSNYLEERISKRFEELLVSPIPLPELLEQDTETDIYKLDSEICALKKNGYVKEDLTRLVAQFGYLKQYYLAGVGYTEADFEKMIQESEAEKMHTEHKTPPITDAKLHELIQIMNRFAIVRLLNNEAGNKAMYALRPVFKQVAIDSGMSYEVLTSLHLEEFLRVLRRESAMIDPLGAMNTALISGDKNYILAKGSLERFKKEYFSEDLQGIKELRGTTTYGGIVRGIVRIISGDSDFGGFNGGEVLVCSMTDPNLVPLMKVASAFVTDMGGILCHAAILSRELKKPCIIGTKIATQVLHDGDLVEVDAENGVVRILERVKKDSPSIFDREWFKFIERSEHFFVYTLFAQTDSHLLHMVTGFAFPESLYRYQNGLGANYRDREMYQKANEHFFSLIESTDPRIPKCAEEGVRMNKHADQILAEYRDAQTLEELQSSDFRECLDTALDILLYGCTIPYLFLEAADYAKSIGKWEERHEQYIRALEPLRAVSKYFEFEELVLSRFFEFAAEKLQLNDHALARFLTPGEIEQVFAGTNSLSEQELKQRSEWCIFWTQDDGQNFTFSYDRDSAKKYAFLVDPVIHSQDEFSGTIAFKGHVRGKVRIVNTKAEMENFEDGEVLVSQSTNPTLMPVILKCSGIITDEGGMASHASIISRELKKPCIVGTKIATQVLHDGDLVEVDADNGVVRVLEWTEEVMVTNPTLSKFLERDTTLVMQSLFSRGLAEDIPKVYGFEMPYLPMEIHYATEVNVQIWENEQGNKWLVGHLLEKNLRGKDFIAEVKRSYKPILAKIEKFWQAGAITDIKELSEYLTLVQAGALRIAICFYVGLDERTPKEVQDIVVKMREKDELFARSDEYIRDCVEARGGNRSLAHLVLAEEFIGELPTEEELERRSKGFVLIDGRESFAGTLESYAEMHSEITLKDLHANESIGQEDVRGQAAFGGKVIGNVRIIKNRKQATSVVPGDIIVAPMTTPDFLPAMKRALAFVTDEGGITCHAAIVARELKKPCIIGTKIATQVLHDGDLVEVDADNGVVRVLERNKENI